MFHGLLENVSFQPYFPPTINCLPNLRATKTLSKFIWPSPQFISFCSILCTWLLKKAIQQLKKAPDSIIL